MSASSGTFIIVVGVLIGVIMLGLMVRRSRSRGTPRSSPPVDFDALERSEQFALFHIVPQQFSPHPLIAFLTAREVFDFEGARNTLFLPKEQALADKLGISVYSDTPLSSYIEGVQGQLDRIWLSNDGVAAQDGDEAAAARLSDRTGALIDTLKAGLVNGDLMVDVKRP